jgi:NADPH-dependent curcumin reductase CurA
VADVKAGETVLVSAAAGAVGGLAGQIAKAHGCRVIGIAGGSEKCSVVTEELGFDEAIDYKADDLDAELRRLCPNGVDVYFDNVGGQILDTVLVNLALGARVAVCGQMSQYMAGTDQEAYGVRNLYELVVRNARMEGFIPPAYAHRFEAIFGELGQLLAEGKISHRPHIVEGWDSVPEALGLLLSGGNVGKLIAQVEQEPWG